MDVKTAVETRRSYRALEKVAITDEIIYSLAEAAQLMPSCFNNQSWRYVFVKDDAQLKALWNVYAPGNEWCREGSLVIAVFTKKELDCVIRGREYALFDTGLATGALMLRATELGLVTHAIAGYDEGKGKEVLGIPADMQLITFIIVGKKALKIPDTFTPQQKEAEIQRPARKPFKEFAYIDRYEA